MTPSTPEALNAVAAAIIGLGGPTPEYVADSASGDRLDLLVDDGSTVAVQVATDCGEEIPDAVDLVPGQVAYVVLHIVWGPRPGGGDDQKVRAITTSPQGTASAALGILAELDKEAAKSAAAEAAAYADSGQGRA